VRHHEFRIEHRQSHHRSEERRIGTGQGELHRLWIDRGNAGDAAGEQGGVSLPNSHQPLEGEDHVIGGHDIAGMKLHVRTEREDIVSAVDLPRGSEVRRNWRPVLSGHDQRVIEVECEHRPYVVDALVGIGFAGR
jgi:hypothetical protein